MEGDGRTQTTHPTKPLGSGWLSVSVVNSPVLKAQILTQQSAAPLRMNLSFSDRDRDLAVRGQGRTDGDGERERERQREREREVVRLISRS